MVDSTVVQAFRVKEEYAGHSWECITVFFALTFYENEKDEGGSVPAFDDEESLPRMSLQTHGPSTLAP